MVECEDVLKGKLFAKVAYHFMTKIVLSLSSVDY